MCDVFYYLELLIYAEDIKTRDYYLFIVLVVFVVIKESSASPEFGRYSPDIGFKFIQHIHCKGNSNRSVAKAVVHHHTSRRLTLVVEAAVPVVVR